MFTFFLSEKYYGILLYEFSGIFHSYLGEYCSESLNELDFRNSTQPSELTQLPNVCFKNVHTLRLRGFDKFADDYPFNEHFPNLYSLYLFSKSTKVNNIKIPTLKNLYLGGQSEHYYSEMLKQVPQLEWFGYHPSCETGHFPVNSLRQLINLKGLGFYCFTCGERHRIDRWLGDTIDEKILFNSVTTFETNRPDFHCFKFPKLKELRVMTITDNMHAYNLNDEKNLDFFVEIENITSMKFHCVRGPLFKKILQLDNILQSLEELYVDHFGAYRYPNADHSMTSDLTFEDLVYFWSNSQSLKKFVISIHREDINIETIWNMIKSYDPQAIMKTSYKNDGPCAVQFTVKNDLGRSPTKCIVTHCNQYIIFFDLATWITYSSCEHIIQCYRHSTNYTYTASFWMDQQMECVRKMSEHPELKIMHRLDFGKKNWFF